MKRLMLILTVLCAFSRSAFAQMSAGQESGAMSGGGWGMNSAWLNAVIIALLIILGIVYLLKRK